MIEDTIEPSLPAQEINLKACAPSGRPFRSVRTVSQPTEPPRQANHVYNTHRILKIALVLSASQR